MANSMEPVEIVRARRPERIKTEFFYGGKTAMLDHM
jgi:hypothetical protein